MQLAATAAIRSSDGDYLLQLTLALGLKMHFMNQPINLLP